MIERIENTRKAYEIQKKKTILEHIRKAKEKLESTRKAKKYIEKIENTRKAKNDRKNCNYWS